jgi:hypothetical protein
MRLADLQELFWATARREDAAPEGELSRAFVRTRALDATSRMNIYADMYVWRQIDVLREDFPKLAALMGDEDFYRLGEAYVRAHPSTHHSLSRFGRNLAGFLSDRPDSRPDLGDLAALEWARADVFEEADVATASPEALRELAAGRDFPSVSLTIVPALRSLRLDHDVVGVWQALEEGRPAPAAKRRTTFAVAWRKGFDVFHVRLQSDEARALSLAAARQPLAVICEAFGDRIDPVEAAFRAIGSWFAEGWIRVPAEEKP